MPLKQIIFSKVAGLQPVALLKTKLLHRYFRGFSLIFSNTYFKKYLSIDISRREAAILDMESRVTIIFSLHSLNSFYLSIFWKFTLFTFFFSIKVFFHGHWRLTGQQGKRGGHLLFHSTTSTRSQTFRHLFAALHMRWLSHIFNRTTCIYQTATRWDLPITTWLIDDVMLFFVCLLDDLILGFCYSNLTRKTCRLELGSTITHVLQANWLAKCTSQMLVNFFCESLFLWIVFCPILWVLIFPHSIFRKEMRLFCEFHASEKCFFDQIILEANKTSWVTQKTRKLFLCIFP